jgi:DnaJ domain
MNFKNWLEAVSAYEMSTPEAMELLGLGPDHTPEQLEDAYRRKAMEAHPDKGGDAIAFKKVQAAYDRLKGGNQGTSQADPFQDRRSEMYRDLARQMAPTGQYTMDEFNKWIDLIVERQYFQVKPRQAVSYVTWGTKLSKDGVTMPLGSVAKTFRVTGYAKKGSGMQKSPRDSVMELFAPHMSRIPEFIVDMKVNDKWPEAWITMETPNGKYQTVSFAPVVKKEKKDPGVGMKKDEVEEHLRNSGLRFAGSYAAGSNYGVSDDPTGYFVQTGPKVVRIIKRYRIDYYGTKKIETMNRASEHYGKMTKELLDKYVAFVKRQSQHAESFAHGGGVDRNFAMAVYSIMHNKADATDWEIIDSVPKDQAMEKIRSVLSDNGVEGEELEREMGWWKGQIEATGKWN